MYAHDESQTPGPASVSARDIGYFLPAAAGALALLCLVTGRGTVAALVFGTFAGSLALAISDSAPVVVRVLAGVVAVASGFMSLAVLMMLLVFMTGDF